MNQVKIPRSFGTHDGKFHADEVTACALLLMFDFINRDKIVRTRNQDTLARCEFVCDVGGFYDPPQKLFDHHQVQYEGELSSAGMILLYLRDEGILNDQEYLFFNDNLIYGVDAHDNGRDPQIPGYCSYSHVISNFNPISYEATPEELDKAYDEALTFAMGHLKRLWERYQYVQSCREVVAATMERDKECLLFEKGIPWMEPFFELGGADHPALFVIIPSGNHWNLRGVPPTFEERMNVRHPLPEEWAGLLDEDLKKATGIPGAIFCHKGRFVSVWETREDALKALEYTLQQPKT